MGDESVSTGSVTTQPEIDYTRKFIEHGQQRLTKILPINGLTTSPLNVSSYTPVSFEIPTKVVNLKNTVLQFKVQFPALANNTFGIHADGIAPIQRMTLRTRGGQFLVDLVDTNVMTKVVMKWATKLCELMKMPIGQQRPTLNVPEDDPNPALDNGVWETYTGGFQACNSGAHIGPDQLNTSGRGYCGGNNAEEGLRSWKITQQGNEKPQAVAIPKTAALLATRNGLVPVVNVRTHRSPCGSVARIENRYLFHGPNARYDDEYPLGNVGTEMNYRIKLGDIPHNLFTVDKDLYFGETLVLDVYFAPLNQIGFAYNPVNNIAELANGEVSSAVSNIPLVAGSISDVALWLSIETNPAVIQALISKVTSTGLRLLVPFVYTVKYTSSTSPSQSFQQRINRTWGRNLLRIYYSPFNQDMTSALAYNNDNNNGGGSVTQNFYTTLDQERLQEVNIDCLKGEDYLFQQKNTVGSCVLDKEGYQSNWTWVDDWTGLPPCEHRLTDVAECGIPLEGQERTWSWQSGFKDQVFNHYHFVVTQKELTILPNQITLI